MVEFVDSRGQPIKRNDLAADPQTASVAMLQSDYALHPSRGLTPAKLARILEDAERGSILAQLDLFDDLEEKDGHIFAELSKRRRALLGLDWDVVPPRNPTAAEKRAAEQVAEIIRDLPIEDIVLDMADAIGKAFACLEIDWQHAGAEWFPRSIDWRPQRWFQLPPNQVYTDELRLRDGTAEGEALRPAGWIVHRHKARSGYIGRAALGRVLAWPFLFKNYSVRDLAEFLEIYGLPLRLGTYPPGSSDKEKSTLMRALVSIGHAAAGIIPEGMQMEFKEAAKGASGPFTSMIDWCERTQSKAILGQTLTAEARSTGLGSNLARVHDEVRRDILISDARQIAITLTRDLVNPLTLLNVAGIAPGREPRFAFITQEPEDLGAFAEALPKLAQTMRIPARWAHEKLNIPEPQGDEPVLGAPAQRPGSTPARRAALRVAGDNATSDQQIERLQMHAQPPLDDLINSIRDLLDQVGSMEELGQALLDLYPQMDTSNLAQAIGDALAAGELAGRYDLLGELNG